MLRNIIPQVFYFRDPMATTLKPIPISMPTLVGQQMNRESWSRVQACWVMRLRFFVVVSITFFLLTQAGKVSSPECSLLQHRLASCSPISTFHSEFIYSWLLSYYRWFERQQKYCLLFPNPRCQMNKVLFKV